MFLSFGLLAVSGGGKNRVLEDRILDRSRKSFADLGARFRFGSTGGSGCRGLNKGSNRLRSCKSPSMRQPYAGRVE